MGVWIKVPGGLSKFWMYYGNKAAPSVSDPNAVFDIFEDFESDKSLEEGWSLVSSATDTCTTAAGYNPGDINSFYITNATSVHGSYSLKADTVDFFGGSLVKEISEKSMFTLKAYIYDSLCDGGHW